MNGSDISICGCSVNRPGCKPCGAKNGYVLVSELTVYYVCMRACLNCVIENTVVLMFFGSYFIHGQLFTYVDSIKDCVWIRKAVFLRKWRSKWWDCSSWPHSIKRDVWNIIVTYSAVSVYIFFNLFLVEKLFYC